VVTNYYLGSDGTESVGARIALGPHR